MSLVYLDELCDSISETFDKNTENIVLINTSDVFNGKVLNHEFVPNKDIKGQFKKLFQKGDILYSEIRPANKHYAFVDFESKNYVASTKLMVLRPKKDKIRSKYLYYILKNKDVVNFLQGLAESRSGTFPQITFSELSTIDINLPSLENQDIIVEIIDNIELKIENLEKINRNLQNLIKILYKEYFESFELDNVPDDWELVNIGSIIDIYNGYSYKGAELQESDCGMVTIKNFNRDGSFRIDGFKEIVYSNKIKKHHFINENDVLISCTDVTQDADIIGNCIMVLDKQNYDELIMSMDLVKIESKILEINNFLLASIFKSYNFKKHILGYVNGTTVLHLDKKGIKKFKIALPKDLSELKNISERFELIYAEIQCNQKEINKLTNLRDTLLPKLMSGEIDVS
uniref:restriction endonuclease subunit S n=1 Tax=Methanobrevibacter sp. UBA212 TaxID=1915476 RepID=UPI0025F1402E